MGEGQRDLCALPGLAAVSGGRLEPTGWSHNTIRSFSLRLDPTFHATLSLPTDGNAVVLGKVRAWRRSKLSQLRG